MAHNRYYLDAHLEPNQIISLAGEERHHLLRVMRAREGDLVELVNGRGSLAAALVHKLHQHTLELCIQQVSDQPLPPPLVLALGISRMNHLEWVMEKGTELGATAFWLFPGLRSEKQTLNETQQKRLESLRISAMKQCGRLDLPSLVIKPPLLEWTPLEGELFFGTMAEEAPYLPSKLSCPLVFFVGPEKGLDPKEEAFLQGTLHAKGVKLHPYILRAETAALTALAQIELQLNTL